MSAEFDRDELRGWFSEMGDGTLSADELSRLERLLETNEEARKLWYEQSDLEVGLADWAAVRNVEKIDFLPAATKPKRRFYLGSIAAVAAALVSILWWRSRPIELPLNSELPAIGIAVLTQTVGATWADGMDRIAGTTLPSGDLKLLSGAILVEFYSGARVVIEGPAELELQSPGRAFLRSGKLNAHVPTQAKGFTIEMPKATVVDYGTDFGVITGGANPPEVHVFSGSVEVALEKQPSNALKQGEAVRLRDSQLEMMTSDPKSFLSEAELLQRGEADASKRFALWKEAGSTLSGDAGTQIHFIFDHEDWTKRQLINHALNAHDSASIVGCPWSAGRWTGKSGLKFRGEGDRVRMSLATPMKSVSLLAWVRFDSLPHPQNVILSADSEQPGAIHWHVTSTGALRLEIARNLGRPHADWEAVNSAPFVSPTKMGHWVMLATTFDGSTIRHYGNGRLIGEGASFTPDSIKVGTAELGNWNGGTQRHLAGTMDEFAILSRVMSDEEIRRYFEHGKP